MLYNIAKILHIIGFASAFGVTLVTYFAYLQFWKLYENNKEQSRAAFKSFLFLQRIGMMGFLLVILAGLTMLALTQWSFVSLLWFQIKLGIIGLMFVNGFTLGRVSALKLNVFLEGGAVNPRDITDLRSKLKMFYSIQLLLFITIMTISIFRFT